MYAFWLEAERFYTFTMPVIVIALLLLVFGYIFVYSYTEKGQQSRRLVSGSFGLLTLFSLGYFIYGHTQYRHWVQQNDYIHPGIRAYSYILGVQTDEEPEIVQAYQRSSSLFENLSELDMYEAEYVVQPLGYKYLGTRESTHYFSFGEDDQYAFRIRGDINWTENKREIHGWRFQLTDDRFESVGFTSHFDVIFDSLYLPAEEQKELESLSEYQIVLIRDMYNGWIFGNQRY